MSILQEQARKAEVQNKEMEQERTIDVKEEQVKFEKALSYGFDLLEGANIDYEVREISNDDIDLLETIYSDKKALEMIENYNYILEVKLDIATNEKVEKVYLFSSKDLETGVTFVLNEIGTIISNSFNNLVLDTINLSGKDTLYVTEDLMYGKYIRRDSVGIEFTDFEALALSPFSVSTIEKLNYANTDKEITYTYNVITDPLGNAVKVFLIATQDGVVAKLKKGTFGLIQCGNMSSIELKFLKAIIDVLQDLNFQIALEGKLAKDLNIWDNIDDSTITNIGRVDSNSQYESLVFED